MNELLIEIVNYVDHICGGNQMAVAFVLATITGSLGYLMTSIPSKLHEMFLKHLTTTVRVESTERLYHNLMTHFEENKYINQSRFIRLMDSNSLTIKTFGNGTQLVKLFGKYVILTIEETTLVNRLMYKVNLRYLGRSHDIADLMIENINKLDDKTRVFITYGTGDMNSYTLSEPSEPIIPGLDKLKTQIDTFLTSKERYRNLGIPYTLGILLYGKPGTGKTKLIRFMIDYLRVHVTLVESIKDLVEANRDNTHKHLVVIEELDTLVSKRSTSDSSEKGGSDDSILSKMDDIVVGEMLKALDGVIPSNGRIIVATTNHPDKIDPAILRAGRFDIHLEFDYVKLPEFKRFLVLYYGEQIDELPTTTKMNDEVTGAKLQQAYLDGLTINEFVERFTTKD